MYKLCIIKKGLLIEYLLILNVNINVMLQYKIPTRARMNRLNDLCFYVGVAKIDER